MLKLIWQNHKKNYERYVSVQAKKNFPTIVDLAIKNKIFHLTIRRFQFSLFGLADFSSEYLKCRWVLFSAVFLLVSLSPTENQIGSSALSKLAFLENFFQSDERKPFQIFEF